MKKIKFFSLFLTALMACGTAWAQDPEIKFDATITSGSSVNFKVDEDYMATLTMPDVSSCLVDPASVTINVKMHNVASLGITGDREAESVIQTGVVHNPVDLSSWLGNIYNFGSATMPIQVISNGTVKECEYYFNNFYANQIVIEPDDEEDMRAAWWEITSHVTPGHQVTDDSYMTLKAGSYLQFGDERALVIKDIDLCKGQWTIEGLMAAIVSSENTYVSKFSSLTDKETYKTELFFAAGSVLALGQTLATLNDNCTVTFDCTAAFEEGVSARKSGIITNLFNGMKTQSQEGKVYTTMVNIVTILNDIVGQVDAADNVPATVEFDSKWKVIRGENSLIVADDDHALAEGEIGTFVVKQAVDSIRGGVVYDIDSRVGAVSSATALDLVEAEFPLIAGRPYIFKASADKLEGILTGDVASGDAGDFNGLIGKYEYFTVPATDGSTVYNFMIYNNEAKLCGTGCYIYAGLAYINMNDVPAQTTSAPGRKHFIMGGKGATTGLLEGNMIVPAQGLEKMMINGQFIIVKDGKMFNAQGAAL